MHETWLQLSREGLLLAGMPFLATAMLVFLLKPLALRFGLVDHPHNERKIHTIPTPLIGGAAIAFAALCGGYVLLPHTKDLIALGAATLLLLAVGTVDDRYDIDWRIRIVAQAAAALVLFEFGGVRVESIGNAFGIAGHTLGILSLPFTILATVGLANAVNMADGVDGLAGALCLAALAMLTSAAIYAGNGPLASDLVLMAGCVMGFLAFNLRTPWRPTASAFLGGGSEILGLWIAWAAFRLTQTEGHPVTPVLAPFLIALPVIDCLVLIVRRVRAGKSPFAADCNHMHHRLLDAGFTATGVVAVLVGLSLSIGFVAALARRAHVPEPLFPAVYLTATVAYFIISRGRAAEPARRPTARIPLGAEPAPIRITRSETTER